MVASLRADSPPTTDLIRDRPIPLGGSQRRPDLPTTTPRTALLDDLRSAIRGRVVGPGDDDYDAARALMYGGLDPRPAAIARVADAKDVAAVISIARERELPLSVRSGGHSVTGLSVVDDGIVIDVRDLTAIELDLEGRTAWAGSGLTAVEFSKAISGHGLAVGFGDTGSVGLGGITLGGGAGYLLRKFGLTIDSLLGAELVTADGEILTVDGTNHPDLFWAIRGGGGNFGVATKFRFRLSDVPHFTGGLLVLPATAETVARFVAESEAAPTSVTTIANVMPCPPMPGLEAHEREVVIFALMAVADEDAAADRAMAPFRSLATPIADFVHPIPYHEIYPPEDDSYHPLAVSRNLFVEQIDLPTAEGIMERLEASDASLRAAQIRVHGGACARVPNDATAFGHRGRRIMVNIACFYEDDDDKPRREAWVEEFAAWLSGGDQAAYVNFLLDEGPERTRAAYPGATWDRLREIKARYDPTNLFDGNQNIPPAGG
jgi:FAD/FMN-containing dehydrogenase